MTNISYKIIAVADLRASLTYTAITRRRDIESVRAELSADHSIRFTWQGRTFHFKAWGIKSAPVGEFLISVAEHEDGIIAVSFEFATPSVQKKRFVWLFHPEEPTLAAYTGYDATNGIVLLSGWDLDPHQWGDFTDEKGNRHYIRTDHERVFLDIERNLIMTTLVTRSGTLIKGEIANANSGSIPGSACQVFWHGGKTMPWSELAQHPQLISIGNTFRVNSKSIKDGQIFFRLGGTLYNDGDSRQFKIEYDDALRLLDWESEDCERLLAELEDDKCYFDILYHYGIPVRIWRSGRDPETGLAIKGAVDIKDNFPLSFGIKHTSLTKARGDSLSNLVILAQNVEPRNHNIADPGTLCFNICGAEVQLKRNLEGRINALYHNGLTMAAWPAEYGRPSPASLQALLLWLRSTPHKNVKALNLLDVVRFFSSSLAEQFRSWLEVPLFPPTQTLVEVCPDRAIDLHQDGKLVVRIGEATHGLAKGRYQVRFVTTVRGNYVDWNAELSPDRIMVGGGDYAVRFCLQSYSCVEGAQPLVERSVDWIDSVIARLHDRTQLLPHPRLLHSTDYITHFDISSADHPARRIQILGKPVGVSEMEVTFREGPEGEGLIIRLTYDPHTAVERIEIDGEVVWPAPVVERVLTVGTDELIQQRELQGIDDQKAIQLPVINKPRFSVRLIAVDNRRRTMLWGQLLDAYWNNDSEIRIAGDAVPVRKSGDRVSLGNLSGGEMQIGCGFPDSWYQFPLRRRIFTRETGGHKLRCVGFRPRIDLRQWQSEKLALPECDRMEIAFIIAMDGKILTPPRPVEAIIDELGDVRTIPKVKTRVAIKRPIGIDDRATTDKPTETPHPQPIKPTTPIRSIDPAIQKAKWLAQLRAELNAQQRLQARARAIAERTAGAALKDEARSLAKRTAESSARARAERYASEWSVVNAEEAAGAHPGQKQVRTARVTLDATHSVTLTREIEVPELGVTVTLNKTAEAKVTYSATEQASAKLPRPVNLEVERWIAEKKAVAQQALESRQRARAEAMERNKQAVLAIKARDALIALEKAKQLAIRKALAVANERNNTELVRLATLDALTRLPITAQLIADKANGARLRTEAKVAAETEAKSAWQAERVRIETEIRPVLQAQADAEALVKPGERIILQRQIPIMITRAVVRSETIRITAQVVGGASLVISSTETRSRRLKIKQEVPVTVTGSGTFTINEPLTITAEAFNPRYQCPYTFREVYHGEPLTRDAVIRGARLLWVIEQSGLVNGPKSLLLRLVKEANGDVWILNDLLDAKGHRGLPVRQLVQEAIELLKATPAYKEVLKPEEQRLVTVD